MKEDQLKTLIQKSKRETSPDFTEQLMEKIALRQEQKKTVVWPFKIVFGALVFLLIGLSYLIFIGFDIHLPLSDTSLKNMRMPIVLGVFAFLFFVLNHMMRLHESYTNMEH
ncbi:hypothetical protein [Spongiimicrobium salis]|uniref:hypothetical protein n=1 Tax=Spongiimicrobium salis TaxID=1667022 RepID=UPI00374CA9E9